MKINWFTVIAQVINFLILAWLLKRYLYKPILDAIDEREKKITSRLKDAEAKKAEAEREQNEFNQKIEAFDNQKNELMNKAISETQEERKKLLEEVRNEANTQRIKLEEGLKETEENLSRDIMQKTQQEVFAITRKTLAELASISLEEQSVNVFIQRLNQLKDEEKKQFISAFKAGSNQILVKSAFDLPVKLQTEIQKSITGFLGTNVSFEYKTAPELISGIELTADGYKFAWSISEYMNSLEKSISETIKEKPNAQ